eukprot:290644-Pyramimonas_sp.AAC.1
MIPALSWPQKLPTERPTGPALEKKDWVKTAAALDTAEQFLVSEAPETQRAALDKAYEILASEME